MRDRMLETLQRLAAYTADLRVFHDSIVAPCNRAGICDAGADSPGVGWDSQRPQGTAGTHEVCGYGRCSSSRPPCEG